MLALLASQRRAVLSTDRIADVLWPNDPPEHPDADIATLVSRLRRAVGAAVVVGDRRSGYRLGEPGQVTLDLDRAADLIAEATRRLADGEPGMAATAAAAATAVLSVGPVVSEAPDANWASAVRGEQAVLTRRAVHLRSAAALQLGDTEVARSLAAVALAEDPLDEGAVRALMAANLAAGQHAAALQAYERLRRGLADEFGADPSAATKQLHLAVLRGDASLLSDPVPGAEVSLSLGSGPGRGTRARSAPFATATPPLPLVGRAAELERLNDAWDAAGGGRGALMLLTGAAGVGKTRLAAHAAELARTTGGIVLTARAVAAERSLFLQPIAEALDGALARLPARDVVAASRGRTRLLSRLLPDLPVDEREDAVDSGILEVERLRTFEAVAGFLKELATVAPLLFVLDDLHEAGLSTVELVHYLARQSGRSPMLMVGTVRSPEGAQALSLLADTSQRLELGPLDPAAVVDLADAAGHAERGSEIARRTGGHALYVVELLRDLDSGGGGLPVSLQASVLARVRRCGRRAEGVLRAGAVLGRAFDPVEAATLAGVSLPRALEACEGALLGELLETDGPRYLFVHDLVREAVHASIPEPTRIAMHRTAADLCADQPELEARHAAAAGDRARAARASLAAGELALRRYAAADARVLAGHALDAAETLANESLRAQALLLRARAGEADGAYEEALVDYTAAVGWARSGTDRRLEMDAQFGLGGDVHMALGRPMGHADAALTRALEIARELEDREREVEALGKLAQTAVFGLRHDDAVSFSSAAMAMTRRGDAGFARLRALTSRMVTVGALGEVKELHEVVDELEPLMRRAGDLWLLQFVVSNAATVPLAVEDYDVAGQREREALELNRLTGHAAQTAYFLSRLALQRRLAGDVDAAVQLGWEAVRTGRRAGSQLWWSIGAVIDLASSLMAADLDDEAVEVLASVVPNGDWRNERRLRVLAPLARATGSRLTLDRADALLRTVATPSGSAWMLAGDLYLDIATAWRRAGETSRAAAVANQLAEAARRNGWPAWERLAERVLQPGESG